MNRNEQVTSCPDSILDRLAEQAILVLGAPRSGTTWLAKIIDSHPDVLYRHEPDEILPSPATLTSEAVRPLVRAWLADRCPRTAGKRPYFPKAYQSAAARLLHTGLMYAVNGAARLPGGRLFSDMPVPDLATIGQARALLKSVRWNQGAGLFARTLPGTRTLLILRHPCGQVASVMHGARQRRFDLREAGTDMPFDEAEAIACAGRHGTGASSFQALPDAAKYAWSWLAFNETALGSLDGLPNARIVVYEDLCAETEAGARSILDFCGLNWQPQTADFIAQSTSHTGAAGYYAVFRNSIAAAGRWRTTMTQSDQQAVLDVVRRSRLARCWSDITAPITC